MADKACQLKAKVLYNKAVAQKYFNMGIKAARIAKTAKPGQFVQVRVFDGNEPLLRRPLGIHNVKGETVEILYEVVGKGTNLLSRRKVDECIDLIGPLGNGFDFQGLKTRNLKPILVAGGMGVAPLLFLAQKLKRHQDTRTPGHRVLVLIGAKSKNRISCEKDFRRLGCEVKIATDDGSEGFRGHVSDLLKNILQTPSSELLTIFACGPRPMLFAISRLTVPKRIRTQISLEEHMACGIGACLGCVVKTIDGYKRVCKEGPVFEAGRIIWEEK